MNTINATKQMMTKDINQMHTLTYPTLPDCYSSWSIVASSFNAYLFTPLRPREEEPR